MDGGSRAARGAAAPAGDATRQPDVAPRPPRAVPDVPARAGDTTAEQPWPLRLLVTNIARYLDRLPTVWVEAQIVEVKRRPGARAGFVTLRDTDADVSMTAMIDTPMLDRLGPRADAGARVVVLAEPRFQPRRGTLTLGIRQLRAVGIGELLARIEALKVILRGEGLFDAQRKRPLPFVPRTVGLVCGRASAAERDVVENARARWPAVRFRVLEVPVQGEAAVVEVTAAIRELDADPAVDVIVVARGGGSLEDLLPFSNESVIRAVAAARTPVVSAIGHEVDSPLLDLVADARASTPTDAARLVVPDAAEELARVHRVRDRARRCLGDRVRSEARTLAALRSRPALGDPRRWIDGLVRHVEDLRSRAALSVRRRCTAELTALRHQRAHLRALSPQSTLDRGYAIVRTADGDVVREPAQAGPGTDLDIRVAEGRLRARTLEADQ
jgi:exodeoxyribonuclease VII large subunit